VTAMNKRPVEKLRSANIDRSNRGFLAVTMWTVNIQAAAMATPTSINVSQLENQSFCSPRSRNSCKAARAIASSANPNRSNLRSCFSAFGMKRSMSRAQMMPTGKLTRKTQRQL